MLQKPFTARKERRPIVVNAPSDYMWAETKHKQIIYPFDDAPALITEGRAHESDWHDCLAGALYLAGAGAVTAKDNIIALANRIEAPLATTLKGTGLFKGHQRISDISALLAQLRLMMSSVQLIASSPLVPCFMFLQQIKANYAKANVSFKSMIFNLMWALSFSLISR